MNYELYSDESTFEKFILNRFVLLKQLMYY